MLNEKVCVGYVTNSIDRRITVERWQEIYEAMPIGMPLTATEIAERANAIRKGYHIYSHHNIPPMAKALGIKVVKREEMPCEPFKIEVGGDYFNYKEGKWVNPRYKTIDKVAVYTRLV